MEISALSIGVDIATSVAIVGSAVTFMYNQRRQNKTEAVMKLHEQVRTISIQQLQEELETLARNEAPSAGANAIQAAGQPADGSQRFAAFQCPPR